MYSAGGRDSPPGPAPLYVPGTYLRFASEQTANEPGFMALMVDCPPRIEVLRLTAYQIFWRAFSRKYDMGNSEKVSEIYCITKFLTFRC